MAASHMTPTQIKKAQALVRSWKPTVIKPASLSDSVNDDVYQQIMAFMKKHGSPENVRLDALKANPFVYEDKVVAVKLVFSEMLSADRGLFGHKDPGMAIASDLVVSGIPRNLFTVKSTGAILAGKVIGKTPLKTPFGGEVSMPHLRFVGVYICADYECSDLTRAGVTFQ